MYRLVTTIAVAILLATASISHTADTKVKVKRERQQTIVTRKAKSKTVKKREEVVGSLLKIEQQDGRAFMWFSLRDEKGNPVKTLKNQHFKIIQSVNGVMDEIPAEDIKLEDMALATVLLRDISGSLNQIDLTQCQIALSAYIQSMGDKDLAELVFFDHRFQVVESFTTDKGALQLALNQPFGQGGTALYDALISGLNELQGYQQAPLQALILFTDGEDNQSRASLADVLTLAKTAKIPIFSIGVGKANPQVLGQISKTTRGLYFHATSTKALTSIYDSISQILRGSYTLSFPLTANPGDEVEIEVIASPPEEIKRVSRLFGRFTVK